MKRHYLSLLAAAALLAWHCGDDSNAASGLGNGEAPSSLTVASYPYYLGGFTIEPSTGIVYEAATGIAVGQILADGTVVSLADGATPLFACDTTVLPTLSSAGYLVNKNGVVTDLSGTPIGNLAADGVTVRLLDGTLVDLEGNVIALPENDSILTPQNPDSLALSSASGPDVPNISSAQTEIPVSSGGEVPVLSSSSTQVLSSSASVLPGSVTGSLTQNVQKGANIETVVFSGVSSEPARSWNLYFLQMNFDKAKGTYTISGTVPEYFQEGSTSDKLTIDGKEYTLTLNVGSATVKSSSSVAAVRSSSSAARSSSSAQVVVRSSSSAKSSSSVSGGTSTELKYVSGGASGSGWATRYWDCCKPSCSWTENAGSGNEARMCTANGSKISNYGETSICEGGSASTCTSQIPIVVNDNLAYAFAAVPASNGGACGKCFALTFDGTGKYETKAPHQSLKGKVLVVMASNVGTDVTPGQFDVMIPGGGVGIYNGCAAFGWGSQGEQYGGLLSDCEKEVGYSKSGSALTSARKSCLVSKCNSVFSNDSQAKQGCLFLANWMNAAGNPNHTYREVECPAALKAQY